MVLLWLILSLTTTCVQAAPRNVSIDDTDSSISYSAGWFEAPDGTRGSHHLTESASAFATFRFTGTAVYFMSPKWPYPVGTVLTLDGGSIQDLDLQDYGHTSSPDGVSTVDSAIVASYPNLPNTAHTLRISQGTSRPYAVVDQLIYTVDDATSSSLSPSSSTSTSTSSSASSSPSPSSASTGNADGGGSTSVKTSGLPETSGSTSQNGKSSSNIGLGVALGVVCGVAAILLILGLIWWWRKRHARKISASVTTTSVSSPRPTYPDLVASSPPQPGDYHNPYPVYPQAPDVQTTYGRPGGVMAAAPVPYQSSSPYQSKADSLPPPRSHAASPSPPYQDLYNPYPGEMAQAPNPRFSDGRDSSSISSGNGQQFPPGTAQVTMDWQHGTTYSHPQTVRYQSFQ